MGKEKQAENAGNSIEQRRRNRHVGKKKKKMENETRNDRIVKEERSGVTNPILKRKDWCQQSSKKKSKGLRHKGEAMNKDFKRRKKKEGKMKRMREGCKR